MTPVFIYALLVTLLAHAAAAQVRRKNWQKKWRKENAEEIRRMEKIKYEKDKAGYKERANRSAASRKEEVRAYQARYRADNKATRTEYARNWMREQRASNIGFRILCNLRNRVWCAVNRGYKASRTILLLGCPIEHLKEHLQKQFRPDMTWENYGIWEIDHIRPCASFDLRYPAQQRACFHYSNLQPLWATDNLTKGDKYVL